MDTISPIYARLILRELESREIDPTPLFAGTSLTAGELVRGGDIALRDFLQVLEAGDRLIGNEQSIDDSRTPDAAVHDISATSPSQRAMRDERAVELAAGLAKLPDDQREAVRLRHLEGCTLAELAERFGRSEDAVAALLKRGLENMRKRMKQ